eukprot:NODE_503_length_6696_cov_1.475216.p1 type:complete len:873 gc:universal NODE_503_length_6696_cov_1.475216:4195-1577(-)
MDVNSYDEPEMRQDVTEKIELSILEEDEDEKLENDVPGEYIDTPDMESVIDDYNSAGASLEEDKLVDDEMVQENEPDAVDQSEAESESNQVLDDVFEENASYADHSTILEQFGTQLGNQQDQISRLTDQITQQSSRIITLNSDKMKLQNENKIINLELQEIRKAYEEILEELETKAEDVEDPVTQHTINSLKSECALYKEQKANIEAKFKSLSEQYLKSKDQIKNSYYNEAKHGEQRYKLEIQVLSTKVNEYMGELDSIKQENSQLKRQQQQQLEQFQKEESNMSSLTQKREERIQILEDLIKKYEKDYSEASNHIFEQSKNYEEAIKNSQIELEDTKKELHQARHQIDVLQATNNISESIQEVVHERNTLKINLQRKDAEVVQLSQLLQQYKKEIDEDRVPKYFKSRDEFNEILNQVDKLENDLKQKQKESDSLQRACHTRDLELNKLQSNYVVLKKLNTDLGLQVQHLLNTTHSSTNHPSMVKYQTMEHEDSSLNKLDLITFENIKELQDQNQNLISTLYKLNEKVSNLQQQYGGNPKEKMVKYEKIINDLRAQVENFNTSYSELKNINISISKELKDLKLLNEKLKNNEELQNLQSQLQTTTQQVTELQHIHDRELKAKDHKLQLLMLEKQTMQTSYDSTVVNLKSLQNINKQKDQQIKELLDHQIELQEHSKTQKDQFEDELTQFSHLKQLNIDLQLEITNLENRVKHYESLTNEIQQKNQELLQYQKSMKMKDNEQNQLLNQLKSKLEKKDIEISETRKELLTKLNVLQTEKDSINSQVLQDHVKLKQQLNKVNSQYQQLNNELQAKQMKYLQLQSEKEDLQTTNSRLSNDLYAAEEKVKMLADSEDATIQEKYDALLEIKRYSIIT